jgi:hypothetical protein
MRPLRVDGVRGRVIAAKEGAGSDVAEIWSVVRPPDGLE